MLLVAWGCSSSGGTSDDDEGDSMGGASSGGEPALGGESSHDDSGGSEAGGTGGSASGDGGLAATGGVEASGSSAGSGGDTGNPASREVCTSAPVMLFGSNYYGSDGLILRTRPIAWSVDIGEGVPKSIAVASSDSEAYGIDFTGAMATASGERLLLGREYAQTRNACYENAFFWSDKDNYSKLIFPSEGAFATQDMVPSFTAMRMIGDVPHLALTLRDAKVNPNPSVACPLSTGPTIPGVYQPKTQTLEIYEYEVSAKIYDIVELGGSVYAAGSSGQTILSWKDGKLSVLPSDSPVSGRSFIDRSLGSIYIANVTRTLSDARHTVWKDGEVLSATDYPSPNGMALVDFSVEDSERFSLIQTNSEMYYLRNESEKVSLDTSVYESCIATDLQAFDGHVYVLGQCTTLAAKKAYGIWMDGKLSPLSFEPAVQTVHTNNTGMSMSCQTKSGFAAKLD